MKRKMMVLSVTALLLLNTVTFSLADTTQGETTAATISQQATTPQTGTVQLPAELTLDKAYEIALVNNISIIKAQRSYDQSIQDLKQAQDSAHDIKADDIDYQGAQTKYINTQQKAMAEVIAKQTYDIQKEQLKNQVEQAYYNVLKAEKMVASREASVKISEEQSKIVQNKFKAGSAVKTDVNRAEISLSSAKINLLNAQRDLKTVQIEFNKTLGADIDSVAKLSQTLSFEKIAVPSVEDLTKEALEKRLDLQKAKNTITINQMSYDLLVAYSAPNTYSARNSKAQLENSKLDLIQTEQNIKGDVISTIFQIQKAEESVGLSAKNLEQAKENQSLAQRRYEIGVGTFVDALSASADLENSEADYVEAVYNYNLAKNSLQNVVLTD